MQIRIVRPSERWQFSKPLMEMHHHRKQVFIDRLGWRLAAPGSWLEVDEFDNDHAVYLMIVSQTQDCHLASVRLLPSTVPHMLGSVFSHLCPTGAPSGPETWEISRFVASPEGASGTTILKLHRILASALVEFALLNGIQRYTLVTESRRLPALLSVGWSVLPLSLPIEAGDEQIEALEILIDDRSVAEVRRRTERDPAARFQALPTLRSAA